MKVIKAPPLKFKCSSCAAECEGEEHEFAEQRTNPPTWLARCGFCHTLNRCSPTPLIAKLVGTLSMGYAA